MGFVVGTGVVVPDMVGAGFSTPPSRAALWFRRVGIGEIGRAEEEEEDDDDDEQRWRTMGRQCHRLCREEVSEDSVRVVCVVWWEKGGIGRGIGTWY